MDLLLSGCIATKLDRKLLGTLGVRMMVSLMVGMGPRQPSLSRFFPVGCSLRVLPEFPGSLQTIWPSGAPSPPGGHSLALFFFFPILTLIARDSPSDPHQIRQWPHFPSSPAPQTGVLVVLKMSLFLLWGKGVYKLARKRKWGWGGTI